MSIKNVSVALLSLAIVAAASGAVAEEKTKAAASAAAAKPPEPANTKNMLSKAKSEEMKNCLDRAGVKGKEKPTEADTQAIAKCYSIVVPPKVEPVKKPEVKQVIIPAPKGAAKPAAEGAPAEKKPSKKKAVKAETEEKSDE